MNPKANDVMAWACTKNGTSIEFLYTRNKAATDVTMTVEWSDTLGNDWSVAGVSSSVLSDNGTMQQIKATMPAGGAGRFVHLKVTRP